MSERNKPVVDRGMYRRMILSLILMIASALFEGILAPNARADESSMRMKGVAIDQKLGNRIPMKLTFKDENGNSITLKQVADGKPLIIDMAYFECPGICDVVLQGLTNVLDKVSATPGTKYSINPFFRHTGVPCFHRSIFPSAHLATGIGSALMGSASG